MSCTRCFAVTLEAECPSIYSARSAAQTAAQSVLSHPLAKPVLKNIPEPIAHFANAPGELTRLQESAGVGVRSWLCYVFCGDR